MISRHLVADEQNDAVRPASTVDARRHDARHVASWVDLIQICAGLLLLWVAVIWLWSAEKHKQRVNIEVIDSCFML